VDITAVVELSETPAVTAAVAVDETTLQATVNPSPGVGDGSSGDVVGPASSTDGRAALFDGATGKLLKQSSAAPVLEGDARLSDPRTPTAHAASHGTGGADAITVAQGQVTGLATALSGKETAGAAAAAITAHEGAADAHPGYLTAAEGDAAYATAAQGALAATAVQPAALTSGLANKADLVGGVVPTSQIPGIALVQYLGSVASQSAMLALRGQGGDWCIRTDSATEWVIVANDGASLSDWIQLPTGIAPVSSINGQTGAVTLGTGDLAESGGNLFFTGARAIGAALTGFTAAAGTVAATDSILAALQKVVGNIALGATAGAIGSSGLTMATARILGRFAAGTGAPEEFGLLGLAFNSTNLATLADVVIPLSDETTALTASSTVAKVTIPYWPRATTLTDLPIWAVATAPTGAALQFDIQVGGTSIYLPASGGTYPTIAAGSTDSTASAGTFTTAFAASPTIAVGSVVTFFVRQIGSTIAGAGLKVALLTRRAG